MRVDDNTHRVPDLASDEVTESRGQISKVGVRLSSSAEAGKFRISVDLTFILSSEEMAEAAERMLPGTISVYRRAHGDQSDGKRGVSWAPADPEVRVLISSVDRGLLLYDGHADVKTCKAIANEKTAYIVMPLDIPHSSVEVLKNMADHLGEDVDLELDFSGAQLGFGFEDAPARPMSALPPELGDEDMVAGNLITLYTDDGPVYGVLANSDGVTVMVADIAEESVRAYDRRDVRSIVKICGPSGGKPKATVRRYVDRALAAGVEPDAGHLILAISQAVGRGLIERLDAGMPITDEVADLAVSLGDSTEQLPLIN